MNINCIVKALMLSIQKFNKDTNKVITNKKEEHDIFITQFVLNIHKLKTEPSGKHLQLIQQLVSIMMMVSA